MRYVRTPMFWLLLLVGEIIAYILTAAFTFVIGLFLVVGCGVREPVNPWFLVIPLSIFTWLSFQVFQFARRRISNRLETRGFEVLPASDRADAETVKATSIKSPLGFGKRDSEYGLGIGDVFRTKTQ
jgi:type VI protein secretion system component VasK